MRIYNFAKSRSGRRNKAIMPQGKANTLHEDLLEKEEEISLYKTRLTELEEAFYYNLELISERDLELSVLEKQLATENEHLEEVIRERDELEDLIKTIDEKNNRKIRHLETRVSIKEQEIRDLQRENVANVKTLKKLIDDVKQQQEKKINKMNSKFEFQKDELIKRYKKQIEEKEKFYSQEIDNLAGKLEQTNQAFVFQSSRDKDKLIKAEEENKTLKHCLENLKKVFLEKEKRYLEEIKQITKTKTSKVSKEIQCSFRLQGVDKKIQSQPDISTAFAQTICQTPDSEDLIQKIKFLQEQNEVLKHIVKELKKNKEVDQNPGRPPGCECPAIRTEVEQVNKRFEIEINNLKKILEEDQKQRSEEDAVIQSLETSVTCLKEKLLLGFQEKLDEFPGEDLCTYTYNREIQNEIQVTLLEQKLTEKIDSLKMAAEDERKKIHEKFDKLKLECIVKVEEYLKPASENLLEKIKWEIHKLENKIETEMNIIVRNNTDGWVVPHQDFEAPRSAHSFYTNDIAQEKRITGLMCPGKNFYQTRFDKQKLTNNLKVER